MQATSHAVAEQMLALWHHCLKDASRLYALLEELSIGLTDMKLLHHLANLEAEPTVKELAEHMGLSLPGASRAADALLRRGWVERHEDANDRRMKRLAITPDGVAVLRRVEEARLAGLQELVDTLPQEQLDALSAAIAPVLDQLEARP
ncbi:MAG TPA: MarR family transcriptional regulator [Capillimicrobium sp.]|nr:MarR family transcriptional regulator [Capillimicrobium sp.]